MALSRSYDALMQEGEARRR